MKVIETHSEPASVPDRQPYRLRIEGKHGEVIEITEQLHGGFTISGIIGMASPGRLAIWPLNGNSVIVEVK